MTEDILIFLILFSGFYMAWNIGANDVANAMGTSVGSGAISLRHAMIIAAFLEFLGAFFFGSNVSETIQSGILNPEYFESNPRTLVLGMLASLIGTGIWLQIATLFGWPVSATHAIVGGLVGFGCLMDGAQCIYWKEVFSIFFSWLVSPLLGGLISYSIFFYLRKKIFFENSPVAAAQAIMPKIAFGFAVLLSIALFRFETNAFGLAAFVLTFACIAAWAIQKKTQLSLATASGAALSMKEETITVEKMFGLLQIISACLMAFSHGANDVANAIGPVSAAIAILKSGVASVKSDVPSWALALGAFGIVFGLASWGWRVIETIGKKITEISPTSGFAAEFGAAFTVLLASRFGMPISTTHTLIGAVIGVGLARGSGYLNSKMIREIFLSWIITVPAGAFASIITFTILNSFI